MKRAGGKSDREFISDLQKDRYVDRELSSEIFQEFVTKTVEARIEFARKLEEAGVPNLMGDIPKVHKATGDEKISAESELDQWLTESDTSENLLMNLSDTNETTSPDVYPESIHST